MREPDPSVPRRRRRAVGPLGAPTTGPERFDELAGPPAPDERPPVDDDERLRRDVPPHHGG